MINKKLVLTLLSLASPLALGKAADLDQQFNLHIPVIEHSATSGSQYYWADLKAEIAPEQPLRFVLENYGELAANEIPPNLYPLEDVTEGAAPVILDISDKQARLHFISQIPLACSVIYGTGTDFGLVATDSAMNGGAIIEHNPLLIGLEANTTYYYRLQGTDANGKIYWGPVESFNTLTTQISDNLLSSQQGTVITAVSSNFANGGNESSWGASKAVDGSNSTAWSSNGDGDEAFIELTLPEPTLIEQIKVHSRAMSDGSAKILSFQLVLDNETIGPFTLPDTLQAYSFPVNKTGARLRFEVVTSTGGNTGLVELVAY